MDVHRVHVGPAEERRFRYEQRLSLDGLVERIYSISVVAALPDDEREAFLGRVREAAAPFGDPVVYLYWTEVFVSGRR